ncbi:hypothetical protein AVEN_112394-1 [Araneus ventricosus]|uniref:Uncharacterized protein n=1 Tax=Araneus ventricosus TaxID=182803 RepID=A0A4Y2KX07_ARAVE|nr:hypothetical protein AVEN_112394-1 [Araneus ventricosus]
MWKQNSLTFYILFELLIFCVSCHYQHCYCVPLTDSPHTPGGMCTTGWETVINNKQDSRWKYQLLERFTTVMTVTDSEDKCGCGEQESHIHYATDCPLTSSFHLKNPAPIDKNEDILFPTSYLKIS